MLIGMFMGQTNASRNIFLLCRHNIQVIVSIWLLQYVWPIVYQMKECD